MFRQTATFGLYCTVRQLTLMANSHIRLVSQTLASFSEIFIVKAINTKKSSMLFALIKSIHCKNNKSHTQNCCLTRSVLEKVTTGRTIGSASLFPIMTSPVLDRMSVSS
jgi:hypothetical protein